MSAKAATPLAGIDAALAEPPLVAMLAGAG